MFTFFSFQEASSLSLTLKPSCLYFFSKIIYKSINHSITEENFIADFKEAEFRPLYKNDGRADKPIYQPISILSNVSKIYERCLYNQLYDYFDKNIFPKHQCSCRTFISTKRALLDPF